MAWLCDCGNVADGDLCMKCGRPKPMDKPSTAGESVNRAAMGCAVIPLLILVLLWLIF